jgi:hypothetical protein
LVVGVDLGFEAAIMAGVAAFFANVFMIDGAEVQVNLAYRCRYAYAGSGTRIARIRRAIVVAAVPTSDNVRAADGNAVMKPTTTAMEATAAMGATAADGNDIMKPTAAAEATTTASGKRRDRQNHRATQYSSTRDEFRHEVQH